jgi:hypothetical protein
MFRERDQINDAVNKMTYGFLFADYNSKYFMWETGLLTQGARGAPGPLALPFPTHFPLNLHEIS